VIIMEKIHYGIIGKYGSTTYNSIWIAEFGGSFRYNPKTERFEGYLRETRATKTINCLISGMMNERKIEMVKHDPSWKMSFKFERREKGIFLGSWHGEHIGKGMAEISDLIEIPGFASV
jgi:hypothetical protein